MSRRYAELLGTLGFATCLARGLVHQSSVDQTLLVATLAMAALALAGAVIGAIAGGTVEEAVRQRLALEMTTREKKPSVPPGVSAAVER